MVDDFYARLRTLGLRQLLFLTVFIVLCSHGYHLQCIMQWAQRSRECPLCFHGLQMEVRISKENEKRCLISLLCGYILTLVLNLL